MSSPNYPTNILYTKLKDLYFWFNNGESTWQNLDNQYNNGVRPFTPQGSIFHLTSSRFPTAGIPPFQPFRPPLAVAGESTRRNLGLSFRILLISNGVRPFTLPISIVNPASFRLPPPGIPSIPPFRRPPAAIAEVPIWGNPNNPLNIRNLEINNGVGRYTPQGSIINPAGFRLPPPRIPRSSPFRPPAAVAEEPIWRNPNNPHNFQNPQINNGVRPYTPQGSIVYPASFRHPPPGIPPIPPFRPPATVIGIPIWQNPNNPQYFQNLQISIGVRPYAPQGSIFSPAGFHLPPPEIPPIPPFIPPVTFIGIPIWWNPNNPHNFQNLPNLEINNGVRPPNPQGPIFIPPIYQFPRGGFYLQNPHNFHLQLNDIILPPNPPNPPNPPQPPQIAPANNNAGGHRWLNLINPSANTTATELLQSLGLIELMKNLNALHLFQSLLTSYTPEVTPLINIAQTVTSDKLTFLHLATHQYASNALIALLKRSTIVDNIIYKAVINNFFELMTANYSHFLIIATLQAVNRPKKKHICKLVYKYVIILATHERGCIGLKRLLPEMKGTFRKLTVRTVKNNAVWLSFDEYGTYVVQEILNLQEDVTTEGIAYNLRGKFFELSVMKQGSYVVEKCLKSRYGREFVLMEFMSDEERLLEVAMNEFGNYVVMSALIVVKLFGTKEMLEEFMEMLRTGIEDLKIGYGKYIAEFIRIFGNGDEIDEIEGYRRLLRFRMTRGRLQIG